MYKLLNSNYYYEPSATISILSSGILICLSNKRSPRWKLYYTLMQNMTKYRCKRSNISWLYSDNEY